MSWTKRMRRRHMKLSKSNSAVLRLSFNTRNTLLIQTRAVSQRNVFFWRLHSMSRKILGNATQSGHTICMTHCGISPRRVFSNALTRIIMPPFCVSGAARRESSVRHPKARDTTMLRLPGVPNARKPHTNTKPAFCVIHSFIYRNALI